MPLFQRTRSQTEAFKRRTSTEKKENKSVKTGKATGAAHELKRAVSFMPAASPTVISSARVKKAKNTIQKVRPLKRRLLVGEGTCTYAMALLIAQLGKHPGLAEATTVTIYEPEEEIRKKYGKIAEGPINFLKLWKTPPVFNVDATKLHENPNLAERYERIQFNCPHDGSPDYSTGIVAKLVQDFFISAAQKQLAGDRIHIVLPKRSPDDFRKDSQLNDNEYYKAYVYNVYEAARAVGYQFYCKRGFKNGERHRYQGYQHVQTRSSASTSAAYQLREYIFAKVDLTSEQILQADMAQPARMPKILRHSLWGDVERAILPETETDTGSSIYALGEEESEQFPRMMLTQSQ